MRNFFRRLTRRRRALDQIRYTAVLGSELALFGTLRGSDHYLVCGRAEANADLDGAFALTQGGYWRGNITATHVVIAGEVHGNVTARAKLEILAGARILGNLRSPVIAIAEGAVHEGEVRMARRTRLINFVDQREDEEG